MEIAKKIKCLSWTNKCNSKKISKNKQSLKNINVNFDDLPEWFRKKTISLSKAEKNLFLKNFSKEPSIHIVFKDKDKLSNFEEDLIRTTEVSGFLVNRKK